MNDSLGSTSLVTDFVLPAEMSGAQVAAQAHELRPGLKVPFTTGYARNALFHHDRLDQGVQLLGCEFRGSERLADEEHRYLLRRILDRFRGNKEPFDKVDVKQARDEKRLFIVECTKIG